MNSLHALAIVVIVIILLTGSARILAQKNTVKISFKPPMIALRSGIKNENGGAIFIGNS